MTGLNHTPFSPALNRPHLLLGGERKLVILVIVSALIVILSDISVVKIALGLLLWLVSVALLRRMAKYDPDLSAIYLRRVRYQAYYPAQSRAIYPS